MMEEKIRVPRSLIEHMRKKPCIDRRCSVDGSCCGCWDHKEWNKSYKEVPEELKDIALDIALIEDSENRICRKIERLKKEKAEIFEKADIVEGE